MARLIDIDELRQRSIPERIPSKVWDKFPEGVKFKARWLDRYEQVLRSLPKKYIEAAVKVVIDRKRRAEEERVTGADNVTRLR